MGKSLIKTGYNNISQSLKKKNLTVDIPQQSDLIKAAVFIKINLENCKYKMQCNDAPWKSEK